MTRAYLALGSNLGDRLAHLQGAVDALDREPGVDLVAVSDVYETDPVGGPEQGPYLNAVLAVDVEGSPRELLELAQRLESDARRVRREHWGPRTLDVDILLFGDTRVDEPELMIPHPRMWERAFVLIPLHDVAPDLVGTPPADPGVRKASVALVFRTSSG